MQVEITYTDLSKSNQQKKTKIAHYNDHWIYTGVGTFSRGSGLHILNENWQIVDIDFISATLSGVFPEVENKIKKGDE